MTEDVQSRLSAALSDRYAMERELGADGIATAYWVHDLKHDCKVAVKVIRTELSSISRGERFLREVASPRN